MLEFFSARGIIENIITLDRDEAIRMLCENAAEQGALPHADSLSKAVLDREHDMGTAIEEGIALPHARLKGLLKPVIVFGRAPRGIEWDAPDGNPTRFIFLILTPLDEDDLQVQTLSLIIRSMSLPNVRQTIMDAPDKEALWTVLRNTLESKHVVRK